MPDKAFHPLAETYPLLEGSEYDAFKADVAARGQLNDIWLYEGMVLDGRNRYRACGDLGIEPRFRLYAGDDPAGFVESQNLHRRHLTAEFRRRRVAELRAEGKSTREIADELGVGQSTVMRDLRGSGEPSGSPEQAVAAQAGIVPPPEPNSEPDAGPKTTGTAPPRPAAPEPPTVRGRDGKRYSATRPQKSARPKPPRSEGEEIRAEITRITGRLTRFINTPEGEAFVDNLRRCQMVWVEHRDILIRDPETGKTRRLRKRFIAFQSLQWFLRLSAAGKRVTPKQFQDAIASGEIPAEGWEDAEGTADG